MKLWLLPSSRQRGIPFILPDDWTPEQALAVLELLDDLREVLWARYQIRVQEFLNDDFCTTAHSFCGEWGPLRHFLPPVANSARIKRVYSTGMTIRVRQVPHHHPGSTPTDHRHESPHIDSHRLPKPCPAATTHTNPNPAKPLAASFKRIDTV